MNRLGDWIQTYSGRQFWPLDVHPDDIVIEDIAHALSMKCRYGGHVERFYSVAEHSVLVSRAVSPSKRLAALLHDGPEAYSPFGDVVRPLKKHFPFVAEIEDSLAAAIRQRFGVQTPFDDPEIRETDTRILIDERAALLGPPPADWGIDAQPLGIKIPVWPSFFAEKMFLRAFEEYSNG